MSDLRRLSDRLLFTPTQPVQLSSEEKLQSTIDTMMRILAEEGGIGISANQCAEIFAPIPSISIVGFASEVALKRAQARYPNLEIPSAEIVINPKLIERSDETYFPSNGEGCLSVPFWFRGKVRRHRWVVVRYQDRQGKVHEKNFSDLKAHIIQHEIDHLQGLIFLQRVISDMTESQREHFLTLIDEILENPSPPDQRAQTPTLAIDRDDQGNPVIIDELIKGTFSALDPVDLRGLRSMSSMK
jgi:peptide deformylase